MKAMAKARARVVGSMVAGKAKSCGVDKRTVLRLFTEFKRPYILNTGGPCALFRASKTTGDGYNDPLYGNMSQDESYQVRDNNGAEAAHYCAMSHNFFDQ
jgi:hypothetical protein